MWIRSTLWEDRVVGAIKKVPALAVLMGLWNLGKVSTMVLPFGSSARFELVIHVVSERIPVITSSAGTPVLL